jgi:nucleoside-diphosphate-sugar epimerase
MPAGTPTPPARRTCYDNAMRVLVTGATGLVGSNVCRMVLARGDEATALVRPAANTAELAALGVVLAKGDVTDAASVKRAAEGCDGAVHCAAMLGGLSQNIDEFRAVNVDGTMNVLDAALARTVVLSTTTFFAMDAHPLTESSPVADASNDPYTITKREAFLEMTARAHNGQDVIVVVPGGIYGPAPVVERALAPTSFNRAILSALRGRLGEYVRFPIPWVFVDDVARATLLALERGEAGGRYIAMGQPDDAVSTAAFLNRACELAGVEHRLVDVDVNDGNASELERTFGPSLVQLARRSYPTPFFDNAATVTALDYHPTSLDGGLVNTIDWLRNVGRFP